MVNTEAMTGNAQQFLRRRVTSPRDGAILALIVFFPFLLLGLVLPLGIPKALIGIFGAVGMVSAGLALLLSIFATTTGLSKRANAVVEEGRGSIVFPGFRPPTPRGRRVDMPTPAQQPVDEPTATVTPEEVAVVDAHAVDLREQTPGRVRLTK